MNSIALVFQEFSVAVRSAVHSAVALAWTVVPMLTTDNHLLAAPLVRKPIFIQSAGY